MPSLGLRRDWTDDDGMLQVTICADNGRCRGTQDIYANPDELAALGAELRTFPSSPDHSIEFEYGQPPDSYAHLRIRVSLVEPTGLSAIEFRYDNRRSPPQQASGLLYLQCCPAAVNALGTALVAWARDPERELRHEWNTA